MLVRRDVPIEESTWRIRRVRLGDQSAHRLSFSTRMRKRSPTGTGSGTTQSTISTGDGTGGGTSSKRSRAWRQPNGGLVARAKFIPLAEERG